MQNQFSVVSHWPSDFDEAAIQKWAEKLRAQLEAPRVSLGLVFMAPRFFPYACQVLELLRVHAQVPLLVGCSSAGLIAGGQEIEEQAGLVLGLFALPGAELRAVRLKPENVEEANDSSYWHAQTGLNSE